MNVPPLSPNRRTRPWRRSRRSRRNKSRILPWLVVAVGAVSAIVLAAIGIWSSGFGFAPDRQWQELQAEFAEKQEPLFFESFIPAELPDEQNFFASPIFRTAIPEDPNTPATPQPDGLISKALDPGKDLSVAKLLESSEESGRATLDVIASRLLAAGITNPQTDYLLVGDRVLAGLNQLGFDFTPLQLASTRTAARFPVDYANLHDPALPHLGAVESLASWLGIQAIAHISVGDSAAASGDILLIARLADSIANEPFLDSQLTRQKLIEAFCSAIQTGLRRGAWTAEEELTFRAALRPMRPMDGFLLAVRAERARLNTAIEQSSADNPIGSSSLVVSWLGAPADSFSRRQLREQQTSANIAIQRLIESLGPAQDAPSKDPTLPPPVIELPISARERLASLELAAADFRTTAETIQETDIACSQAAR